MTIHSLTRIKVSIKIIYITAKTNFLFTINCIINICILCSITINTIHYLLCFKCSAKKTFIKLVTLTLNTMPLNSSVAAGSNTLNLLHKKKTRYRCGDVIANRYNQQHPLFLIKYITLCKHNV